MKVISNVMAEHASICSARWLIVILATAGALLGCGQSKVSSRQLDYNNGLAYLHGETKPFDGVAVYEPAPAFVTGMLGDFRFDSTAIYADSCEVDFVEGVREGDVLCKSRQGETALTLTIHHDRLDGEVVANNKNGDKLSVTRWKDGAEEGKQEFYTDDGKYIAHSFTVENGRKRGKEVYRAQDGDNLSEGSWDSDGKFTGSTVGREGNGFSVTTYDNDVKDGPYLVLSGFSEKDPVVEGQYKAGQVDGTWTYHQSGGAYPFALFRSQSNLGNAFEFLTSVNGAATKILTFNSGVISGPVKLLDKDDRVVIAFEIDGTTIKGPIERFDPASGRKLVYKDPAIIAALNWTAPQDLQQMRMAALVTQGPNTPQVRDPKLVAIEKENARNAEVIDAIVAAREPAEASTAPAPVSPSAAALAPTEAVDRAPQVDAAAAALVSPPQDNHVASSPAPSTDPVSSAVDHTPPTEGDPATSMCVDGWVAAFHKEQGEDALVAADQLQEWQQECQAGKKAP